MRIETKDADGNVTVTVVADPPEVVNAATLTDRANAALTVNATYLAIPSPTAAQNTAQVKALTAQVNAIVRLYLGRLDSTS